MKIRVCFALIVLVICSGCGTFCAVQYPPSNRVYWGVHMDAELIDEGQEDYVIDYPFSFIADTLLLPVYLCTHPAVPPDLLVGWKSIGKIDFRHVDQTHVQIERYPCDKAISDDVQKYLNSLPIFGKGSDRASYNYFITQIIAFEDGTGRHAVKIETNSSGSYSTCFLIYDKSNVRIKLKRYRL